MQGYPEYQTGLAESRLHRSRSRLRGRWDQRPGELEAALRDSLHTDAPTVVDDTVNPEERTMSPRINAKQAVGYGVAKAREFFGAGDGAGGTEALRQLLD